MEKLTLLRNHISESEEIDESDKIKLFRFINNLHIPPTVAPTDSIGIFVVGTALEIRQKVETIELKEAIGAHLKSLRESNSISREGMAALINVGRGTLDVAESPMKTKRTLSYEKISGINTLYLKAIQAKNLVLCSGVDGTNTNQNQDENTTGQA